MRFEIMAHFVHSRLFWLNATGLFLLFAQCTLGQGTRYLIDPDYLIHKPAHADSVATPAPQTQSAQSSRALTPSSLDRTTVGLPGMLSGGNSTPTPYPSNIRDEWGNLFMGNSTLPLSMSTATSTTPPVVPKNPSIEQPDHIESMLEDETDDEREIRMLYEQRQRAEQIADPEQRQEKLEQIQSDEASFQKRLARRQENEIGTEDMLFYTPRLKERWLKDGWCQLFDGHTNFGWKIQTEGNYAGPWNGGKFTFGQGEIGSDPRFPGMIYTQIPFGDINLRFDYWAEKNSRIFLLLNTPPDPADLNKSCYTFVLNSDQSERPRGLLLGRHDHTLPELRDMRNTWDDPRSTKEGTWHSVVVKIEEGSIQFWLNKRAPITYFVDKPLQTGHIALLVTKGKARFQNILWRPTQSVAIFEVGSEKERPWRLSERGEVIGNNDTGFSLLAGSMESKEVFTDYVVQMQYRQGAISGKSSLWVRSLPEKENAGYEISLQNAPTRYDRETIRGVDAGGFIETMDARYIRALDRQWTYFTMVAMDRQMQTWINGVPVCEIHDKRAKKDVLSGPFLNPGTIRVSVPKENDQFQFRRVTVSPM